MGMAILSIGTMIRSSEAARGAGVGRALINCVYERAKVAGSPRVYWLTHNRRFMLATRDANGLYVQFGFTQLANSSRMMEILNADAYRLQADSVVTTRVPEVDEAPSPR
jgi:GNAT superfamily N-acetyltransferase